MLLPHDQRVDALKKDYKKMSEMFFKDPAPPEFDMIMNDLKKLQDRINNQRKDF